MKRAFLVLTVFGVFVLAAGSVLAGGIDHKTNFSAEYARTLNRNAATDSADAAVYNPAGTALMDKGFYVNGSLQYIDKTYTNKVGGTNYESDTPSYIPSLFAVYKRDNWSTFVAFSNYGGGGQVEYDNGNATTVAFSPLMMAGANASTFAAINAAAPALVGALSLTPTTGFYDSVTAQNLDANSMYLGYTLGGAYKFNDKYSASFGLRIIDAYKEAQVGVTLSPNATLAATISGASAGAIVLTDQSINVDYEETATGVGAILGLNIVPSEKFNIGIRYETNTALEFKRDTKIDDTGLFADGEKFDRDLPPLLGLGVAYNINDKMRTEFSYTLYMNTQADWDGAEDEVDDGFDIGASFEYDLDDAWTLSAGYLFTESGISAENTEWSAPRLDANSFGGGFVWKANERLDVNFGISSVQYKSAKTDAGFELEADVLIVATGIEYRFL